LLVLEGWNSESGLNVTDCVANLACVPHGGHLPHVIEGCSITSATTDVDVLKYILCRCFVLWTDDAAMFMFQVIKLIFFLELNLGCHAEQMRRATLTNVLCFVKKEVFGSKVSA
jgi:hypothetical protein